MLHQDWQTLTKNARGVCRTNKWVYIIMSESYQMNPMNVFLLPRSTKDPEDAKTSGICSDKEFV